jgi:hypothetical protein
VVGVCFVFGSVSEVWVEKGLAVLSLFYYMDSFLYVVC